MNRGSDAPAADLDCNSFDLIGGAKEVTTGVVATNKKAERAGVVNLIVMCIDGYFLLKGDCSFLDSQWKVRLNSSLGNKSEKSTWELSNLGCLGFRRIDSQRKESDRSSKVNLCCLVCDYCFVLYPISTR